jgi:hypothetical protein
LVLYKEYGNVVGGLVVDGSGTWLSGDWYGGTWDSRNIKDNLISIEVDSSLSNDSHSTWINGRWYDGGIMVLGMMVDGMMALEWNLV